MDYNIYIHDKTSGQNKPTTPKTNGGSNTTPKGDGSEKEAAEQGLTKAASGSKLGKIAIAVYAAVKVSEKIVETVYPFVARETGDYRFSVAYSNVKQTISNFVNPIGYATNFIVFNQNMRLYNQKQEQQRLLIGDSFINNVSRKV